MKFDDIDDVVAEGLCCGCGACAYISPNSFAMIDIESQGRRPQCLAGGKSAIDALAVCPGVGLSHEALTVMRDESGLWDLFSAWGPVLEVFEGFATDPKVRFSGSSGGAVTAIASYCIEVGGMLHALHTAGRLDQPHLNETIVSRTTEELLRAAGSRYAPASPCESLQSIEDALGPCVFIGKPCDIAAAQKARKLRPKLDQNIGVTIGFFCAGTPSTRGTLELLKRMGVEDPNSLVRLRYRGNGWPGRATAVFRDGAGKEEERTLSYDESWGEVLAKHQQWRCKLCADHTGEFADIAVGDPWYREIVPGEPGRSLILARTERGRSIIQDAADAGYIMIYPADPQILPASQPNLLRTRGALWGRILACRIMGARAPRYNNMPLFVHWWRELSVSEKIRSIAGTAKRLTKQRRGLVGRTVDRIALLWGSKRDG